MFNENQKFILQMGAVVVISFFLALVFGAGFFASILWALILGLVIALLLNANHRATSGRTRFHDIAHGKSVVPNDMSGSSPSSSSGTGVVDKVKQAAIDAKDKATNLATDAKDKAQDALPGDHGASSSGSSSTASGSTSTASGSSSTTSDSPSTGTTSSGTTDPTLSSSSNAPGSKPQGMKEPRTGGPDDLTRINGVGPKLRDMLHDHGYYHFDQIANWSDEEVAWIDDALEGFKGRASRDNWVGQAKVLSAEKSAGTT